MQSKRERPGYEMTLVPSLDALVPVDHQLRRLDKVLDLSFVHDAVREKYCPDNGRPSIDPEVVIRLFLIQALYGYHSVRRLMREVQVNLAYRWFIGYRLDESLPDHSSLSRALDRFGDAVFNELFGRSIAQCQTAGLIEGKVLHVDATTIRADLDANRVKRENPPDADARFGRFGDGKKKPGYKQHTVADGKARVIVGLTVTPADRHEHDQAVVLIDQAKRWLPEIPVAVCADSAYASGKNAQAMHDRGIRLIAPPPRPKNPQGDDYFSIDEFTYDEAADRFICPAGKILRFAGVQKRRGRRVYRPRRHDCPSCPLKAQCTSGQRRELKVTADHASLARLRADSRTTDFKAIYRHRAPVIEGVFAESKQWHGLHRAWRRGLTKMTVQCLLVAAVINLKRLMAVNGPFMTLLSTCCDLMAALWRRLGVLNKIICSPSDPTISTAAAHS